MIKLVDLQIEIFLLSFRNSYHLLFLHLYFTQNSSMIAHLLFLIHKNCLSEHFLFLNNRKMFAY